MNRVALPLARLPRRSFAKAGALALFLVLSLVSQLHAQVGNDNPTGVSGIFNGNITTGCSYDPYTGNAMRSITDITIANAVGTYGLSFTRTSNSRGIGSSFGLPGAWRHPYEWGLDDSLESTGTVSPNQYQVNLPDGRYEYFQCGLYDTYCGSEFPGVSERFQRLNTGTLLAYLILADGGKIEFKATLNSEFYVDDTGRHQYYWYTFVAQAIIDPYGLRTTFAYGTNSMTVTEPAGRYITINWGSVGGLNVITSVQGSDGRRVTYNYGQAAFSPGTRVYVYLASVSYYSDSSIGNATYTYRAPNVGSADGLPLLLTCNDPMYAGPMKKISYTYQTTNNPDGTSPVYGQIKSENYPGGPAVSTLTVTNSTTRKETRADSKTRTFTYSNPYRMTWTDFKGVSASQTLDANKYVNSVIDRNGNTTNFTRNALIGVVTQIQYPLTQGDTPGQTQRPTVNYTYGSSSCADTNNQDANNPYYVCTAKDEGNHVTQFTRDTNKRVTRIDYPDGGYETFAYNSFGEVTSHRMTTGGTETFSYDTTGLKLTYRDPYHASGNPSAWYQYDSLDRVSAVTDALGTSSGDPNHTTNFTYNTRGQVKVTTHPTDPVDGVRHTITNYYNPDGTLYRRVNELNQATNYTYDDYRRMRGVTTPARYAGDPTNHTTNFYYDASGTTDDYRYADASVTYVTLPSGKRTRTTYDENRRKLWVAAAYGTNDAATTSYGYDNVGNVTSVVAPNGQAGQLYAGKSTITVYDERNRPSSIKDALLNTTRFTYDTAGRKKTITRPNGQTITYDTFDAMNRVLHQTVTQAPDPNAYTIYTYTPAGLLSTMQDPHLVAIGSSDNYTFTYDLMGRKAWVIYPPDSGGVSRGEQFTFDTVGRLSTFRNRTGHYQTFTYDALNRMTGLSWDDNGVTPSVTFGYDIGSRLTSINNANATISRSYWNDNLLRSETSTYADNVARTVNYTYDADANRATIQYPGNAYSFTYNYTGRNQLKSLVDNSSSATATYWYDVNGNLSARNPGNPTSSSYSYDALNRVTSITHSLAGESRTFGYGYDNVGNRNWTQRDGGTGDVLDYDLADQTTVAKLNVANPSTTAPGSQTIFYDANGNRTWFTPYGPADNYTTNELNQYTQRNSTSAAYNLNGDISTGLDGSSYVYDAQNRLTSATTGGVTESFKYDGLNRQVSRTVGGVTTYNVYDGWDLIAEYQNGSLASAYLNGAGGLVKNLTTNNYYYQDASGSTSHLVDSTGHLLEWYRYDLQGAPFFYDANDNQLASNDSAYGVRHLFTGQQWYSELGLYDLRNRFYSPDIGRFLQPDPIGFWSDPTNLYRYCANNPAKWSDPSGLGILVATIGGVTVTGTPIDLNRPNPLSPVDRFINDIIFGGSPSGEPGGTGDPGLENPRAPESPKSKQQQQQTVPTNDPYANNNTTPSPTPMPLPPMTPSMARWGGTLMLAGTGEIFAGLGLTALGFPLGGAIFVSAGGSTLLTGYFLWIGSLQERSQESGGGG